MSKQNKKYISFSRALYLAKQKVGEKKISLAYIKRWLLVNGYYTDEKSLLVFLIREGGKRV